ncbi:hypothetical protein OPV22_004687 [Ensete ventricosum]|uniref:Uncharacterized protein n=1 Tax=Ensete ventricosum TaxID=4639 RepID=A0AAV8Q0K5_ENSVE|nr:hypothetical protein OPV22_004687 [Ensete ventricosum]
MLLDQSIKAFRKRIRGEETATLFHFGELVLETTILDDFYQRLNLQATWMEKQRLFWDQAKSNNEAGADRCKGRRKEKLKVGVKTKLRRNARIRGKRVDAKCFCLSIERGFPAPPPVLKVVG